jgi:hypothetical protein
MVKNLTSKELLELLDYLIGQLVGSGELPISVPARSRGCCGGKLLGSPGDVF